MITMSVLLTAVKLILVVSILP
jgi:hypothetical protein